MKHDLLAKKAFKMCEFLKINRTQYVMFCCVPVCVNEIKMFRNDLMNLSHEELAQKTAKIKQRVMKLDYHPFDL